MLGTVPRSLRKVKSWLWDTFHLKLSSSCLTDYLTQLGFRYKRMRQSSPSRRDDELYRFFKQEMQILQQMEDESEIDLYYFDETGFSLTPVVPYGWQPVGQTHRLPSMASKNHTLAGFMNRACQFMGFRFEGAATSKTTILCFEAFLETIDKKTVVVLDNASIHKSNEMKDKIAEWRAKGLHLQFIPAYCPELNLIERLWKEFKYQWLDQTNFFEDWNELAEAVDEIARNIGTKYTVNFY